VRTRPSGALVPDTSSPRRSRSAIIAAVRITTSHRSPAASFSASAPTAPNVASISAAARRRKRRANRLDDALRRTRAQ
jgi:hypothetical protein